MPKKKARFKPPTRPTSYYELAEIKTLAQTPGAVVIRPDAALDALSQFGWEGDDVLRAIGRLRRQDFVKTDPSQKVPGRLLDFYRASMEGEKFYTHFYVDSQGRLIINSFHKP